MQANTAKTERFDPLALAEDRPVTVYLVLPPEKLESHAALLRLWVGTLIRLVLRRRRRAETSTLFLIDEAAQLGPLDELRQAVTLMTATPRPSPTPGRPHWAPTNPTRNRSPSRTRPKAATSRGWSERRQAMTRQPTAIADHLDQTRLDAAVADARGQDADWLLVGLYDPATAAAVGIDPVVTLACRGAWALRWTTEETVSRLDGVEDMRVLDLTRPDLPSLRDAPSWDVWRRTPALRSWLDQSTLDDINVERVPEVLWVLPGNWLPDNRRLVWSVVPDEAGAEIWAFALRHQARRGETPDPPALLADWANCGLPGPGTETVAEDADRLARALADHRANPPGPWVEMRMDDRRTLFLLDLLDHRMPRYEVDCDPCVDIFQTWFRWTRGWPGGPDRRQLVDRFEAAGTGPYLGEVRTAIDTDARKRGLPPFTVHPKTVS